MSLRRLRRGELLLATGLAGLLASLFLRWFTIDRVDAASGPSSSFSVFGDVEAGWGILGTPFVVSLVLLLLAGLAALVTAARAGAGRPTYGAVIALVGATLVTIVAVPTLLVRILLATPSPRLDDLGDGSIVSTPGTADTAGDPASAQAVLSLDVGAWVGVVSLLVVLVGVLVALADDRTTAAESVPTLPPARPVPPHRPAPASADADPASPAPDDDLSPAARGDGSAAGPPAPPPHEQV